MRGDDVGRDPKQSVRRALLHSLGITRDELSKPFVAVVNSFTEIVPGHAHLQKLAEKVKDGIRSAGGVPFEFNTIAICDGLAGDRVKTKHSFSPCDLIADSIEVMIKTYRFDAMVMLPSCSVSIPGHLMAAARLNIPTVVLTGGPMQPGRWREKPLTAIDVDKIVERAKGRRLRELELSKVEEIACPGAGSCPVMNPTNAMMCLTEALGMSLPRCATTPAQSAEKLRLAKKSGFRSVRLLRQGIKTSKIMTREAFENTIRVAVSLGCEFEAFLHLPAIAKEFGIDLDASTFERIGEETPQLCALKPNGPHTILDLHNGGGIPAVMKRLENSLNLQALTVSGKTLKETIAKAETPDPNVILPPSKPVRPKSALVILRGNLAPGGAVIRDIPPKTDKCRGPAKVFENLEEAMRAVDADEIEAGDIMVIRYEGQRSGKWMRELTGIARLLREKKLEKFVPLITDGRLPSQGGLSIELVRPEAAEGGPIAAIENGDEIEINIPERRIEVSLTEREIKGRLKKLFFSKHKKT